MKYTMDKKAEAMARMAAIGVQKTSEEMNISVQTLYKWRNEAKDASSVGLPNVDSEALRQLIENEEMQAAAIKRLEGDAERLRDENAKLRQENARLKIAIKAFIG
ncbi:MAG: hypothetical protein FWD25_08130 [Clostridia bacterium]|nr:hypothetical protein [Clostridia bacterium]